MPWAGIEAVAEQMQLIGEATDGTVAGVDNGKPQVAAVEPDRRQTRRTRPAESTT